MKIPDDILAFCERMSHLGFQHIFFHIRAVETIKPLEIFAKEIIPAVADLGPVSR